MHNKLIYTLLLFLFSFHGLTGQDYDFSSPIRRWNLPDELREISDITMLNKNTIACIQDEKGIIYTYSLLTNSVIKRDSFYLPGDYEGIARINRDLYILRSDAVILQVKFKKARVDTVILRNTGIPAINNEGIFFDKDQHCFLIASKSRSSNIDKDLRCIYKYELSKNMLDTVPFIELNNNEIREKLKGSGVPDTVLKKLRIKPSAIAMHPTSKKLYVLSASSKLLCIYNNKMLESVIRLDPVLFNKAEGICFSNSGDLFISNEGQTGSATILNFKVNKKKKRKGM